MNLLAIDTSSEYLSLAVQAGKERHILCKSVVNQHSRYLLDEINLLLQRAAISVKDLDVIAYIEGPGSFTGLRIGLSVAMGISFGTGAQLAAIPAFMLYAMQAKQFDQVLVGIDARLNQVYLAGVDCRDFSYFLEPQLLDPDKIVCTPAVALSGNGFHAYAAKLPEQLKCNQLLDLPYPDAGYMLDMLELNQCRLHTPDAAGLVYLRNKVALNLEEQRLTRA